MHVRPSWEARGIGLALDWELECCIIFLNQSLTLALLALDLETGPGYLEGVSVSQGDEFLFMGNNSLEKGKERAIWSI